MYAKGPYTNDVCSGRGRVDPRVDSNSDKSRKGEGGQPNQTVYVFESPTVPAQFLYSDFDKD